MTETEKQTPITQSLCGSLRRDGHWKCLGLSLMITGCLAAILWCHFDVTEKAVLTYLDYNSSERSGPCKEGYIYIPVACVVMLYLVYLVECWHSHTWLELRYKCDVATVYDTIGKMQEALPVIWWKATCYHYVRRTRQVMRYRNGDAFTSTQIYYERVDSNTAGAAFNFTRCGVKDISRPLSDLEKYPAIKIKISKGFSFANLDTEFEFEEQRSQFFHEYETKDDYMEGREGMDLINVDFKEYMIAFRDPNNLPWYVSHVVFWMASFILLSWPLRAIIEFKTAHLHYHIHKLFGSNYLESENYPGLISRVSTMNSADFEMSIRNNNVLVPSYSEVMLADAHEHLQRRDYGTMKKPPYSFPRSLTNVTLSARTSSANRTCFMPAVTMNQVKKFKSCNVFGKSQSTESSLSSSSIRQQIQHLLRDRARFQGKASANGGSSSANENARLNTGTPGTPEEVTTASSFSHQSEAFRRASETLSGLPVSGGESFSRFQVTQQTGHCPHNMAPAKPKKLDKRHLPFLNRSKSVPVSDRCGQSKIDRSLSVSGNGSSAESISESLNINPTQTGASSLLSENNGVSFVSTADTATTSPSSLPSPPGYEEAVKMRRVDLSLVSNTSLNSVNPSSEIGLAGSSSEARVQKAIPVSGIRDPVAKRNTDSVLESLPIELEINKGHSKNASSNSCGISGSDTSRLHAEGEQFYSCHYRNREQHRSTIPIFKPLPKVSSNCCVEPEESDLECLHSTSTEIGGLDNAPGRVDYLSNRTSRQLSFGLGSISHLATILTVQGGANELMNGQSTSLNQRHNRSTPSTSVSSAAAILTQSCRSQAPSRLRMETSV